MATKRTMLTEREKELKRLYSDYVDKFGVKYSADRKILISCTKNLKGRYTIPDGVKCIRADVFWGCEGLIEVNVPDSVEKIEYGAFEGVPNINYHGKAEYTGSHVGPHYGAFTLNGYIDGDFVYSDSSRTHLIYCFKKDYGVVTIPACVESIGEYAFYDCYNITYIRVEKGNQHLCSKEGVLFNKNKTELIKYPTDCSLLGPSCDFVDYKIPEGVKRIRNWAFSHCRLHEIFIPNSIKEVEENAFAFCAIHIVKFTGTLEQWCKKTWKLDNMRYGYILSISCEGVNTYNLKIPDTLSAINDYAFYDCKNLQIVHIPSSIKKIGKSAFQYCTNLHTVKLSEGLEVIGEEAFAHISGVDSLVLPGSVKEMGENAFNFSKFDALLVPKGQKDRFAKMKYFTDTYYLPIELREE